MKNLLELIKIRIAVLTTLSGALGFVLSRNGISPDIFGLIAGILVLASGSSALNQVQESAFDRLMERTKNRPIPSGKMSKGFALFLSVAFIVAGEIILFISFHNYQPVLLGLLSVIWYNGIYTPLKRITPFAVFPGAVIGALPPAIGWTAAGGVLTDPEIILIMVYFFVWQIPHFWLLLMIFHTQYEVAGYPSLLKILDKRQLGRMTFIWTFATVVLALLIPFYGIMHNILLFTAFLIVSIWLLLKFAPFIYGDEFSFISVRKAFMAINIYALTFMVILFIQTGI